MNFFSSFSKFYDNLSSGGLLFFWIIVFLFCFLIFLSIVLVIKNRKLMILLEGENKTNSEIESEKQIPVSREITFPAENNNKILENTNEVEEEKEEAIKEEYEEVGPYKKNVLREMNTRAQTSPISITKEDVIYNTNDDYELNDIYLREENPSILEEMEDSYEINENMKFASEIVERMEEEIKPSNIELTDYEKKQEEEAIISYDELLKVKDKIYNITDDEETDEFIDELKSFRLDL